MKFYKIIAGDGVEMPIHYSGRHRTCEEAKKMVDSLNRDGEYPPYNMVRCDCCSKRETR